MQTPVYERNRPPGLRRDSYESDAAGPSSRRPSIMTTIPQLRPSPAYIAVAAASQLATDNQRSRVQDELYDLSRTTSTEEEDAIFSESGLATINQFLDNLLYNILLVTRSTSLPSLQAAVEQVLGRGKLAKAATATANEELEELSADGADPTSADASQDHILRNHVEFVFRRTRLRIMVYTRLGEMEDEDEETYLQDESLWTDVATSENLVSAANIISPAATIFLTSVLEYVAEQCVEIGAQAAATRTAHRKTGRQGGPRESQEEPAAPRVVVEDYDVERIALNSALGRLWRTWKKTTRTPRTPGVSSPISPTYNRQLSARSSYGTLRPLSGVEAHTDNQVVGGESDLRSPASQSAATRTTNRMSANGTARSRPISSDTTDEERNRGKTQQQPLQAYSHRESHDHTPPVASFQPSSAPRSSDEMRWEENKNSLIKRTSGEGRVVTELVKSGDNQKAETSLAVPVSGILHHHLPSKETARTSLGSDTTTEDPAARHDFGTSQNHNQDENVPSRVSEPQLPNGNAMAEVADQSAHVSQANTKQIQSESSRDAVHAWTNDVSSLYQPNFGNTGLPLRVRVPGGGEYIPDGTQLNGLGRASSRAESSHMHVSTPKIVKVVTAKEITPTSDTYTYSPSDRKYSKASFDPLSPSMLSTGPSSPQGITRPEPMNPERLKTGLSPREPTVQPESNADFVDFIRSTAPAEEQVVVPVVDPSTYKPTTVILGRLEAQATTTPDKKNGAQAGHGLNDSAKSTPVKFIPKSFPSPASHERRDRYDISGTPILTRVKNPAFEPRDPVIRGRGTDDLIAFLREGPPGSGTSKPTARETMERRTADKFNMSTKSGSTSNLLLNPGSKDEPANSQVPGLYRQLSAASTGKHEPQPRHSGSNPARVVQKPPRGRDPYAIPTDDEDEDILTALPRKTRNEESLIDFLNSTGPSPGQDTPKAIGLGLRDSAGKGLSLRPTSPTLERQRATAPRSPINASPLGANPSSPIGALPALGEFMSAKNSAESARPASAQRSHSSASYGTPTHTPNRGKETKHVKVESKNGSVRGFLRKMAT